MNEMPNGRSGPPSGGLSRTSALRIGATKSNPMNNILQSTVGMLIRVHQYGEDKPFVPAIVKATEHYATVASAKDAMLTFGAEKIQGTGEFRAAAAERRFVVNDLRKQMREISETAKALTRTGAQPGLDLEFRMPKRNMQDIRDRAAAFKAALEPIKQLFIDYDSPATVVEDLNDAIEDFDAVTGRRYAGLGKQIGATASLRVIARRGVTAVRALNAIAIKRYRDNPALLAEWNAAQRIASAPTSASAPAAPAAPQSAPAPAQS